MVDDNDIISDDSKIAETCSDYFTNAVKNLNIIIDPARITLVLSKSKRLMEAQSDLVLRTVPLKKW